MESAWPPFPGLGSAPFSHPLGGCFRSLPGNTPAAPAGSFSWSVSLIPWRRFWYSPYPFWRQAHGQFLGGGLQKKNPLEQVLVVRGRSRNHIYKHMYKQFSHNSDSVLRLNSFPKAYGPHQNLTRTWRAEQSARFWRLQFCTPKSEVLFRLEN